jgi:hypothetical protein
MGIQIDKDEAEQVLREAAQTIDEGSTSERWERLVELLSTACAKDNKTHIAFLGTAMLAKATNLKADVYSVKAGADTPGAHSARSLGHSVLVPLAPKLGIDLGVTGREPLNNQPYFRPMRVSAEMVVHGGAKATLTILLRVLAALDQIESKEEALLALRSFIRVRNQFKTKYAQLKNPVDRISVAKLVQKVAGFVAEDSEGGKRAQAIVAGLLDSYAGPDRVVVDKVNDPDRHMPGDVGVRNISQAESWDVVFEVRDKPVSVADLYHFGEKLSRNGIGKGAVAAVSAKQKSLDITEVRDWAAERGVTLVYLVGWDTIVSQVVLWTPSRTSDSLGMAAERIYHRLIQLEVSAEGVGRWLE